MKRKWSVSFAVKTEKGEKMTTFKVGGVDEHFNTPWHLAIENGIFREEGIAVEWKTQHGGTGEMVRGLHNGDLDVAVLLTEGVTADILKGGPERIVKLFVATPLRWGIHVHANASFQQVADLEGGRFAITRFGSGSHLMAHINADRMGWDPSQLEWVEVGGMDGARKALAEGTADAYMCEQFTTQFLVDKGEFKRVGTCDTPWPCFVIAAGEKALKEKREALTSLCRAIDRASADFMNREDAPEMAAARYEITPEQAREWFRMTRWSTNREVERDMLETVQDTLYSLGIVSNKDRPESLVSSVTLLK